MWMFLFFSNHWFRCLFFCLFLKSKMSPHPTTTEEPPVVQVPLVGNNCCTGYAAVYIVYITNICDALCLKAHQCSQQNAPSPDAATPTEPQYSTVSISPYHTHIPVLCLSFGLVPFSFSLSLSHTHTHLMSHEWRWWPLTAPNMMTWTAATQHAEGEIPMKYSSTWTQCTWGDGQGTTCPADTFTFNPHAAECMSVWRGKDTKRAERKIKCVQLSVCMCVWVWIKVKQAELTVPSLSFYIQEGWRIHVPCQLGKSA